LVVLGEGETVGRVRVRMEVEGSQRRRRKWRVSPTFNLYPLLNFPQAGVIPNHRLPRLHLSVAHSPVRCSKLLLSCPHGNREVETHTA